MRLQAGRRGKALVAVVLSCAAMNLGASTRAGAAAATGGVVLDLYGGLHPFGGASVNLTGAPYWPGDDIARAAVVMAGQAGGWTLDGYGTIYAWGSAPAINTPAYWRGWDIARDLVVLPDNRSGYVLDGYGGLHSFGPDAPAMTSPHYTPGVDIARSVVVLTDVSGMATGGWVMDGYGNLYPFGNAPAASSPVTAMPGRDLWRKLRRTPAGDLYGVARWGVVSDPGLTPDWSGYSDWQTHDFTRDIVLFDGHEGGSAQPVSADAMTAYRAATAMTGGVLLDFWGGLHAFGGAVIDAANAPYWAGWDIARGLSVLPDGSGGWTLDGYGGIHAWGKAPPITSPSYWAGWDIARDFVILPDGQSGYLLDGYGGLHNFGPHAPAFVSPDYTAGEDYSRGVAVVTDSSGNAIGGWVLDGFGQLHPFGSAPAITDPATNYPGYPVWRKLHLALNGSPYAVGEFGFVSAPGLAPFWQGYADWGSDDVARDVQIFNPELGTPATQPASPAAVGAFMAATVGRTGVLADPTCNTASLSPPGGKYIVISLECQRLSAYQDGHLVADMLVTTGRPALPTHEGHTSILRKNHPFFMVSSWPYGTIGWYPSTWVQYVTWIWDDGTGIHDASWEPEGSLGPGSENGPYASHGCVHVSLSNAEWIYYWGDIGTPVDVV